MYGWLFGEQFYNLLLLKTTLVNVSKRSATLFQLSLFMCLLKLFYF